MAADHGDVKSAKSYTFVAEFPTGRRDSSNDIPASSRGSNRRWTSFQSMTDQLQQLKVALPDRYQIQRQVGVGGMATVYLARDVKHDRNVALKVLRPDLASALGPDRFVREIAVAAQLHHPHILPLLDSGDADGTGTSARFSGPMGIASDGINLYVADTSNNKIRKITISTGEVTTLAGPAQGLPISGGALGL